MPELAIRRKYLDTSDINCTVMIALCFLVTSTGWLSWEYHLLDQITAGATDVCTMVIGYLLQAAGIAVYEMILHRKPTLSGILLPASLIIHMILMVPAVLSPVAGLTILSGLMMNLVCGMIAGCYLRDLTGKASANRKAAVFGVSYAVAILTSWLLSMIGGGKIYYSNYVLLICFVLTIVAIVADRRITVQNTGAGDESSSRLDQRNPVKMVFLLEACLLVLLFSIVNSSGFAFPAADLGQIVNVEFSRLVYAAGLLIAGFVTDRNRKHGAICALTALIIPFIIFSLRGEPIPSAIFWVLSYFTFGFYSVYRVILFSDIAAERNLMYLSGAGLLAGRIGDALGEGICLLLADHAAIRVGLTAILFAASVALFFKLYQVLYIPEAVHQQSEKERFAQFAAVHDLSLREQDMLHLILDKKTNSEIADHLCISENTVKFHVRNLLQKTGCKNRKELLTIFETYRE